MASHNVNPVRTQIRQELVEALADGQPRTAEQLYDLCPSATDPSEVSKVTYEMRRVGLIALGDKGKNASNMGVNTYLLASTNPYLAAAKPIQVEPKIKKNRQPAVKRKPAPGHPFAAPISPKAPQERITRPLPIHLQSAAPIAVQEAPVSEDPLQYVTDAFSLEPREPEENVDSDLVDALLELAHQEVLEVDSPDELLAKMVPLPMAEDADEPVKKVCKCVRINSLPPLPTGYQYSSITADVVSDDGGLIKIRTMDDGEGPFCEVEMFARMRFDVGDIAKIGQVADALIQLHEGSSHDR